MKKMTPAEMLENASHVIQKESDALLQLKDQLNGENLAKIAGMMFECRGHILVTGAGTSRAIALRFAHLLACCGTPALPINAADALHGGAGSIKKDDVIFVISKGGQSREINKFVEIAKRRGALIIAQTEKPDSPLAQMADAVYHIVTPPAADPYGMIATATSLVNAIAGDILCQILLDMRDYSREEFGLTHPEGAVGVRFNNIRGRRNKE